MRRKRAKKLEGVYQRGDSPFWWFSLRLPNGKRVRKSSGILLSDRDTANKVYEIESSKYNKVGHGLEWPEIKLSDLAKDYLELHAKHSKLTYRDNVGKFKIINSFMGSLYLHEITPDKLEEYRIFRLTKGFSRRTPDGVSKPTVNREMALLKHAFNKGIEWEKCQDNPVRKIKFYSEKERKRTRYLEHHEKVRLLNACPPPTRRLVFFALSTGMRQGEILNLKWRDVDFKTNLLRVSHSKSGRPRYVEMNGELSDLLKSIPTISEYVFGTPEGKAEYTLYRKPFENAVKEAGLSDLRFHDLRHCFASDLVMKGVDLKTVAELLGHASTQMTERYSHLSPAHKRAAVELLPKGLMGHATVTSVLGELPANSESPS